MEENKGKMKIYCVDGTELSGTTKFGEMLTENLNEQGIKTLYVGESFNKFCLMYKDLDGDVSIKCGCGKSYDKCKFWSKIGNKYHGTLLNAYKIMLEEIEKQGYKAIVDSSKRLQAMMAYKDLGYNFKVYYVRRNPLKWRKSLEERGWKGNVLKLLLKWMYTNIIQIRNAKMIDQKTEFAYQKIFEVKGIFNEHKHVFGGNENKFLDKK